MQRGPFDVPAATRFAACTASPTSGWKGSVGDGLAPANSATAVGRADRYCRERRPARVSMCTTSGMRLSGSVCVGGVLHVLV